MERSFTERHYSLDSLSCRGDRMFGWGWFFTDLVRVRHIDLRIDYESGISDGLRLQHGSPRADVAAAFPDGYLALNSGFVICGRVSDDGAIRAAWLDVTLVDGTKAVCVLPNFPEAYGTHAKRTTWRNVLKRVARVALNGDAAAARRHAQSLARGMLRAASAGIGAIIARCSKQKWDVVFDHALGGGANKYRENWVRGALKQRKNVAVVTPQLASLTYRLELRQRIGTRSFVFDSERSLLEMLDRMPIQGVVINNLVSFDSPQGIIHWTMKVKQQGVCVQVMLHDFFFVCRSFTLLNDSRQYCGVPALEHCNACLSSNDAMFLAYDHKRDQQEWRSLWWALLQSADSVTAFSESTINIANRAYPELRTCRIQIVPHKIEHFPRNQINLSANAPLVIGVVGSISYQKGAQIVREMVELIEQQGLPARIVVVGTIEESIDSPAFRQTGAYRTEELARILEVEDVSVGFLPSVIPETFSYVTSELMALGLPLAVFDLGAPAERVREYNRGCVIASIDAQSALDGITKLHAQLPHLLATH